MCEDVISCDDFPIPVYWARIAGLGFGWDDPVGAAPTTVHIWRSIVLKIALPIYPTPVFIVVPMLFQNLLTVIFR